MKFRLVDIFFILIFLLISIVIIFRPITYSDRRITLLADNIEITLPTTDKVYNFQDSFLDISGVTHNIHKSMLLEVSDGNARMIESSCQDKICVNMLWAKSCGDMIVCMPNQVALLINCKGDE